MIYFQEIAEAIGSINQYLLEEATISAPGLVPSLRDSPPVSMWVRGNHARVFYTGIQVWDSLKDERIIHSNTYIQKDLRDHLWRKVVEEAGRVMQLYTVMINIMKQEGINN